MDTSSRAHRDSRCMEEPPQLLTHLEPELLRGVSLHECLSGFGKHWRPDVGMSNVNHSDYHLSRPMEYFDDFLSHDWGTSRWLKVVSMLIIYNSRAALVAMLVTAIALVPTWWSYVPGCKSAHLELHPRLMVVGICHGVHLLFLCFWQRFRSLFGLTPYCAFLDKLCIAQSPELADLKAKGILGLAAFLNHSKRLVLWSPRYFQRLWCSYEIATFLADGDREKPLVVMPAHSGLILLLDYVAFSGVVNAVWYMLYLSYSGQINNQWLSHFDLQVQMLIWALLAGLFIASFTLPTLSLATGLAESVQRVTQQLRGFRMQDTFCFCCSNQHKHPDTGAAIPCDRQLVYLKLKEWYGNHDDNREEYLSRFNSRVQTDLASSILTRMSFNTPRCYQFYIVAATNMPGFSELLARILHRTTNDCIHDEYSGVLDIMRWAMEWMTLSMSVLLTSWWAGFITSRVGVRLSQYMPKACVAVLLYPLCACPLLIFVGSHWYLIFRGPGLWCGVPCCILLIWVMWYSCHSVVLQRFKSPVKARCETASVEIQTETASSCEAVAAPPSPASSASFWAT